MPWDEFWQSVSVFQAWGWVLALIAGIFLLVKLWPLIRALFKIIDSLLVLPMLVKDIATIKHQVLPNGGDSIADQISSLASGQTAIKSEIEHVKRQNVGLKHKLNEHIQTSAANRSADRGNDEPREDT